MVLAMWRMDVKSLMTTLMRSQEPTKEVRQPVSRCNFDILNFLLLHWKILFFLAEKEEKKKSKNPNIVRPGSKPKTTIKSMFAAQSSTGGSKLKSEV